MPITRRASISANNKTWIWILSAGNATGSDRLDDPEFRDVVGTAVQKELYARGYAKTSENPDLVVNGFVSVQKIDKKYIEENFDGVYTPDYHAAFPEGGSDKSVWEEGTLMLFIYDASKGQVVWYGTAQTEAAKHAVDGMWQKRVGGYRCPAARQPSLERTVRPPAASPGKSSCRPVR